MPLIDLPHVRARAAAIAGQFADTPACLAGIHALFVDYSDQSHRVSQKLANSAPANELKTPAPVVRQVLIGLRQPAQASPPTALALLKGLWAAGTREERRLAAELLGVIAAKVPVEALALVEAWLPEIESAATAHALAEYGLSPLALADPAAHLQAAFHWATHPLKWMRCFALASLRPLIQDKKWDDVPGALGVVRVAIDDAAPEIRQAAATVLSDLLPKSPMEVNLFLREQAARSNNNAHLIVRAVLTKLTPAAQAELIKIMRA
jgi:hypothetical protein